MATTGSKGMVCNHSMGMPAKKKARLQETVEVVASEILKNGEIYQSFLSDRRIARASYFQERRIHKEQVTSLLTEIQTRIKKRIISFYPTLLPT